MRSQVPSLMRQLIVRSFVSNRTFYEEFETRRLIFVRSLFRRAIAAYAYSLRLALEQQSEDNAEVARTLPGFLNNFDRR